MKMETNNVLQQQIADFIRSLNYLSVSAKTNSVDITSEHFYKVVDKYSKQIGATLNLINKEKK